MKCTEQGCSVKAANYNEIGQSEGIYCAKHKKPGMVNVKMKEDKLCQNEEKCYSRPTYGYETDSVALRCATHKLDGMIDVKHKRCRHLGCKKSTSYGFESDKILTHCAEHKLEGMIDLKHKKCEIVGCNTSPSYGYEKDKIIRYCSLHKAIGTINLKHKKCEHSGCTTQPTFGLESDMTATHCALHKTKEMIDVEHKKCEHPECDKLPVYGFESDKVIKFCLEHKTDEMVDLKHKLCRQEGCGTQANRKYDNYCFRCYFYLNPDKPTIRNYKTKEKYITDFVLQNYPSMSWFVDKRVLCATSRRRPDILCDLGYQIIIIEVDENQHETYECSCENKRLMEISGDLEHRPIVFIRFNPDDYIDAESKNIKSCFKINYLGICEPDHSSNLLHRLDMLKQTIDYWSNEENKTDKTVEIIQLFYDQHTMTSK